MGTMRKMYGGPKVVVKVELIDRAMAIANEKMLNYYEVMKRNGIRPDSMRKSVLRLAYKNEVKLGHWGDAPELGALNHGKLVAYCNAFMMNPEEWITEPIMAPEEPEAQEPETPQVQAPDASGIEDILIAMQKLTDQMDKMLRMMTSLSVYSANTAERMQKTMANTYEIRKKVAPESWNSAGAQ